MNFFLFFFDFWLLTLFFLIYESSSQNPILFSFFHYFHFLFFFSLGWVLPIFDLTRWHVDPRPPYYFFYIYISFSFFLFFSCGPLSFLYPFFLSFFLYYLPTYYLNSLLLLLFHYISISRYLCIDNNTPLSFVDPNWAIGFLYLFFFFTSFFFT